MPKLRKTPEQRGDDHITGAMLGWMKRNEKGADALAGIIGCSPATVYNRIKHPDRLTGRELRRMLTFGVIDMEDMAVYCARRDAV